ncbi:MAG: protein-L-isoaspartate(D-aspartate) O-methyltransferase [Alphaproteobacteria bacterium]
MTQESRKIRLIMELRREGITSTRVLSAIERVSREMFVPASFADQAYDNIALPIGHGQTISQPLVVAFMTEKLEVGERMKVLEIGTGSGYQAAVLAPLCRRLYTVERQRALLREAEKRFAALGLNNVVTRYGDGAKGWPEQAPFDRIIVTAAAPDVPPLLLEQLAEGGLMVLPLGFDFFDQELVRVRRTKKGHKTERLMDVRFVPLVPGVTDDDEG